MKRCVAYLAAVAAASAGLAWTLHPRPAGASDVSGAAVVRFDTTCSGCHGRGAKGGSAPSLLGKLQHGDDDASLARSIHDGHPERGMPAFGAQFTDEQIGEMVGYLQAKRKAAASGQADEISTETEITPARLPKGVVHSDAADFVVERVAQAGPAFGFAFLPDGKVLITEVGGVLRLLDRPGAPLRTIQGTPRPGANGEYFHRLMMDVSLHPDYRRNGWIYLIVSAERQPPAEAHAISRTLYRGRIRNGRWVDSQALMTSDSELSSSARIAWDRQGHLYMGTDDSDYFREGPPETGRPQDLRSPIGKILRMTDEGKVPPDNPFVGKPGAYPYVWSYGHRVPVGLAFDRKGELWESENGPRGGDEINHIRKGRNYGWPVITWGHIYENKMEMAHPEAAGKEQPVATFVPSPGLGGLGIYTGAAFPKWRDSLFVGSLKQGDLFRVVVDGDREVMREIVLHDIGRIRQIATGPDGLLWVLTDDGTLIRLKPVKVKR
jgi:glucose/arabinose dehydrogenase